MAAHIEQDSELFTNLVAAQAIPAGKAFQAFHDAGGAPAVFSLGTDGVLNLFLQTNGALQNVNFAAQCGFKEPVTAFAARQAADSSLFIAFSLERSGYNEIAILPNLPVVSLQRPITSGIITSASTLPEINGIYLVRALAWVWSIFANA